MMHKPEPRELLDGPTRSRLECIALVPYFKEEMNTSIQKES